MDTKSPNNLLIRGARQLLTLNGPSGPRRGDSLNSLGLIQDGAVLVTGGVISAVGPSRRVENLAEAKGAIELNATGRIVMPAFVDPHAHLFAGESLVDRDDVETIERSFHDLDTPRRAAYSSGQIRRTPAKTIEHRACKLLELSARHGTGTMQAYSGFGMDEGTELKLLRVLSHCANSGLTIVPTFFVPAEIYSGSADVRDEYVAWMKAEFLPRIAKKGLARFLAIEADEALSNLEVIGSLFQTAISAQLPVKLHTKAADPAHVAMALEHQAVSIEGLHSITRPAAKLLAAYPTLATLIPGDFMNGSAGSPPPARMLVDSGVPVALASGLHHGRTTTYNMQSVISLACSCMKLTTAEAISAATINAAYACGVAGRTGALQFGKDADLLILAVPDYREMSYYFGVNQVQLVMKRGETVFHDSALRI